MDLVNPHAHDLPLRDDRLSGKRKTGSIDPDVRSEYERDVDRVYYDYYFRRLAEITQVSSGHDKTLRHNRMTHSLKVAQVARRLVQYLRNETRNEEGVATAGGIDHNVVTAAGLLHDVGHPPFGHVGEHQLNRLATKYHLADGFEGNAQTLRIILNLTAHQRKDDKPAYGLDLTRAVVAACTKYPYPRQAGRQKWGYYKTEEALFEDFVRPLLPADGTPTLEAEIMDWADDITYAVHDLQDFYTDGIIPLHHLRHTHHGRDTYEAVHQSEFADFWGYVTEKLRRYSDILPLPEARQEFGRYAFTFPESHFHGGRKEAAKIGALASRIITDASKATQVTKNGRLYVEPKMRSIIHAFKQVTWYYVIDHPDLVSTQLGQCAQINQVFSKLYKRVEFSFQDRENGQALRKDEQWIRKRRLPTQPDTAASVPSGELRKCRRQRLLSRRRRSLARQSRARSHPQMSKNVTFHERERRFLVPHPGVVRGHTGNLIIQGYLFSSDGYVVRVRRTHYPDDGDGYHEGPAMVAVKGPRVAAARQEYEVEVPTPFATELIKRARHKVSKTRFQIVDSGQTWDVDVFHGDNEGLVIAECECNDAASISIPYWCGVEVTDDPKYNNENLAADPYKTWSERP